MDNITFTANATLSDLNITTTLGPPPIPPTPPPIGYYGETREMLWKVLPPVIMVWGTIGNLLTFLVLLRQKTKLSSTAMFLMALAVSDTIVLYTGPLRQWLKHMWDYDIRELTDAGCKIQMYITYASIHCSSWLLVAVTTERAMSVVFPHKVRLGCTPKIAAIVIFSIILFTYGINIMVAVLNGSDGYRISQKCTPLTVEYKKIWDDIYQWIDFFIAFAIPFVLLLAGNIIIIVYLQKSRANRKAMSAARGKGATSGRDTRSVSVLMVALCVIFLLTVTPASVFSIYHPRKEAEILKLFPKDPRKAWYDYQYLFFQHAVVNLVSYTNAAFNFILYVFSGTKFRKELKAMFHCDAAGTTGVFGSKVTKSSSKTGTTSISTIKTQQLRDKQANLEKETKHIEGNNVHTKNITSNNYANDSMIIQYTEMVNKKNGLYPSNEQNSNVMTAYQTDQETGLDEETENTNGDREIVSTNDVGLNST